MIVDRFWYANESAVVSPAWHYGSGIFALSCLIFGIISNGLVIVAFLRNDLLRRPRNYYLINLAITDIGLLLTNNSMHVITSFKNQWIFGQAGCNFYSVCGGVFGLTSVATMASISLTRLAAVNDPFSSLKLGSRFTITCLVCTWIYGSVWIIPPLFGWNRFILEGFGTSCTFDYVSKDLLDRIYIFVLVIGGFLLPLAVIIFAYSLILIKLSQRGRPFIPVHHDDQQSTEPNGSYFFSPVAPPYEHRLRSETAATLDYAVDDTSRIRNLRRTEARATRTAILVCAIFCLAWGPYSFTALYCAFGFDHFVNAYSTAMLGLCAKLAACINPMVYALSLNGFREEICSYFKCFCLCDEEQRNHLMPLNHDLIRKKPSTLRSSSTVRQSDPADRLNL